MALIQIDRDPSPRTLGVFGLLVAAFALLLGLLLVWRFDAPGAARWVWIAGAALAVVYYAVPPWRRSIYLGWILAAYPIGWIVSHVVLAVVYYLVLTPIGLIVRLFGRDPMERRLDREASSYWSPHQSRTDPDRYFRQF